MDYDEKNLFDNCRFVADVMKTRQDLRFQALRLIHYVIYRVICDDEDLQTFTGSVTELAEAFHIQRSNIYRDIDSLSAQLHSTGMILGHKDPRKSWRTVTWLSRSCYNGRGTILIKLSYSMVSYVKGIRHMFSDDFHTLLNKIVKQLVHALWYIFGLFFLEIPVIQKGVDRPFRHNHFRNIVIDGKNAFHAAV